LWSCHEEQGSTDVQCNFEVSQPPPYPHPPQHILPVIPCISALWARNVSTNIRPHQAGHNHNNITLFHTRYIRNPPYVSTDELC
jgi:hypothetical protein